jgi:hypothetical protein
MIAAVNIGIRAANNGYIISYKEEDMVAEFVTMDIEETLATVHSLLSEYDNMVDMSELADNTLPSTK